MALFFSGVCAAAFGQNVIEFPVPTPNSYPFAIAAGPDGALWFTEADANKIGRITTAGAVTEFTIPTPNSDPLGIVTGPDGALWFAEGFGNQIGRITTAGAVTEFATLTSTSGYGSAAIAAGPDGALWFTETDTNNIGRITTAGAVTEFPIPTAASGPVGIVAGPDGALWFTEVGANKIGRITTAGAITEFATLTASPGWITAGPDGALWFTEYDVDKIGRITTTGAVIEFPVPTPNSYPFAIAAGPDGALWFTEGSASQIGRITTPSSGPCVPDATTLCLNGGRFEIRVTWSVPSQGRSGVGNATPLTSDTGYFWFFNSDNVELVVKALDAVAVNGHYWVFYGALSNVQYTMTVTDTVTGAVKTYENPAGTMASVADTSAFTPPAASSDSTEPASAQGIETRTVEELYGLYAALTELPARSKAATTDPCTPGGTSLCLNQSRFQVSVDWEVPSQGRSGHGTAVPITSDTGYFWFFNSDNVELVIKALDARGVNGHYWVFYGALSNVHYTITVTDTQTGLVNTYENPSGTLASVADTTAF